MTGVWFSQMQVILLILQRSSEVSNWEYISFLNDQLVYVLTPWAKICLAKHVASQMTSWFVNTLLKLQTGM